MRYVVLTLLAGACITILSWYGVNVLLDRITQERFKSSATEVESIVASRIREYFSVFNFTQGVFVTQNDITAEEFYAYYDSIQLGDRYPGFTAISFTAAIDFAKKESYVAYLKDNQISSASISAQIDTQLEKNERYIVSYVYPPELYKNTIGTDLTDNLDRKAAIESARNNATLAVTKPTKLLTSQQPGFVAYLPLYAKGSSIATEEQRKNSFVGVISGGFNSNTFFQEILPSNTLINELSIHMYDGSNKENENLIFARETDVIEKKLEHHVAIPIGDRTWNMYISADSLLFLDPITRIIPRLVLIIGSITTVLACLTVYLLSSSRIRALNLAEKMTAEVRDKSEKLIAANKKLQGLDKLKDEFVSVASHELRTPMTAIKGLISMIFDGDYGKVTEQLKEPLTDIQTSTERLIYLVNDMLNVSRIEAGRLRFDLTNFKAQQLAQRVVSTLQPLAKQKDITLTVSNFPELLVQADDHKFQQVLNNLVGNALKFTEKGSITVSAKVDGELLKTYVSDTGMGITHEDQPKLFAKFAQISSQQLGKPAGTGLGLYISKEIIEHMGGTMWIEQSELGKGSTFAFSVPLTSTNTARKVKTIIEHEAQTHQDQKSDTIPTV